MRCGEDVYVSYDFEVRWRLGVAVVIVVGVWGLYIFDEHRMSVML